MDIVTSVNGMTGDVVLGANGIKATPNSNRSIERVIEIAYEASAIPIAGTENDYMITITKRSGS